MQFIGYWRNSHCGTASSVAHNRLSAACVDSSEQLSLFVGLIVDGEQQPSPGEALRGVWDGKFPACVDGFYQ
jgi:hypothetical protein